ncbi:MAG TPA: polysaccharide deacetylase family protein [Pseudonocardiaceae bacterium]|nr:polysaccharide deacetylase family protein [Pseudonocardiaceae bacterium]
MAGVLAGPSALAAAGPTDTGPTIVSMTFDDAWAEQNVAADILHKHGLNGTFYVISGVVGTPGHFALGDLRRLVSQGNEIGGHTVSHPHLSELPADEARRQICADRTALVGWGLRVTSFAYPYGSYNRSIEAIAADCGYNSARIASGIRRPWTSPGQCERCPLAETVPPADPYAIRVPPAIDPSWTLAEMQRAVTNAEDHGGGWVVLAFHHVRDDHSPLSVSPAVLDGFTAWLAQRKASGNVRVATVDHMIRGVVRPSATRRLYRPMAS